MPKNPQPKVNLPRQQRNQLLNGSLDEVLHNLGAPAGTAAKIASRGSANGQGSSQAALASMSPKDRTKVLSLQLASDK